MIDHGFGFGLHVEPYAIIGSSSQALICDNRHCDSRTLGDNGGMSKVVQTEAIQIFARVEALDVKQRELANLLEIDENKITKVKTGIRRFTASEVIKAQAWLDQIEAKAGHQDGSLTKPGPVLASGEIVEIQKLDLSLSMGPGTLIDEWVEAEPVKFDLAFIRLITRSPSDRLKLVTGIGDSMYPTLNWGDAIMIDTTDRALARQDGIYWIDLYGAAGIKRLRTVGKGRVLVVSDNPGIADQEVDAGDLRIEGRAVWVARGL
jgi:phage repressor protein C with HTH and peptisase S24 domain